jgi:hypothetical protein
MISTAFTLACLITASLFFLYNHLPREVRRWVLKHGLLVDFVVMIATFTSLGTTVTALIAGAIVDLFVSAAIHIMNHKEDFAFIFDTFEMAKELLKKGQVKLQEVNSEWKKSRTQLAVIEQ